ncbi:MAG: MOSC domain-containing protein [Epsilonproteobacteria bacterium]|nr:MOSC domain-containing protein [Campylobacterota bacterium]
MGKKEPFIKSLQIGEVGQFGDKDSKEFLKKYWESGSFKKEVIDGVVTFEGIIGDMVSDIESHGGREKAVFANSDENYPLWSNFLGIDKLPFGALAENLTISGLDETTVFLGDIHQIGEVILRVSQPRKPCWKISRKWQNKEFTNEIYTSGRTGWYYEVLKTGKIVKNDTIVISRNGDIRISIMEANQAFREPKIYQKLLQEILLIQNISISYKESIKKRLEGKYDLGFMKTDF